MISTRQRISFIRPLTLGLVLATLASGCGGYATRMRLTKELTAATGEVATLLATVKDRPTAEAAAPKLKVLVERTGKLSEQFEEYVDESDPDLPDKRTLKLHGEWLANHVRIMQEQHRISKLPEAKAGLGEVWDLLTGGAYDPGGVFGPGGAMDMDQALSQPGAVPP